MSNIGHNNPPEEGWKKAYFYMPVGRAEIQIELLETMKQLVPFESSAAGKSIVAIVDEQIAFLREKIG